MVYDQAGWDRADNVLVNHPVSPAALPIDIYRTVSTWEQFPRPRHAGRSFVNVHLSTAAGDVADMAMNALQMANGTCRASAMAETVSP